MDILYVNTFSLHGCFFLVFVTLDYNIMCFPCTILWACQLALVIENLPTSAGDTRDPGSVCGLEPWRRKWQLTLVFLPGEFHGQRNLTSYNPWGCRESDITEEALHKGTYHQKFRFHQSPYVFYQSPYLPPKITFPSVTSWPLLPIHPPSTPFPSGNQCSALYIYVFVFIWFG